MMNLDLTLLLSSHPQWQWSRRDPLHDFVEALAERLTERCETDVVGGVGVGVGVGVLLWGRGKRGWGGLRRDVGRDRWGYGCFGMDMVRWEGGGVGWMEPQTSVARQTLVGGRVGSTEVVTAVEL